jgi:hypothetical protein
MEEVIGSIPIRSTNLRHCDQAISTRRLTASMDNLYQQFIRESSISTTSHRAQWRGINGLGKLSGLPS